MLMAISVLAALYQRKLRTGQGEHLQLAMQDAILHYCRIAFTYMERDRQAGAARRQSKTVAGGNPPIGAYPLQGRRSERLSSTSTPAAPTPDALGRGC